MLKYINIFILFGLYFEVYYLLCKYRIIVVGQMSTYGYITKFHPQSINAHPDFISTALTMNSIPASIDSIIVESIATISSVSTQTVTSPTYTLTASSYSQISVVGSTSDIYFQVDALAYSILENNSYKLAPNLSWSSSGSTVLFTNWKWDNLNLTLWAKVVIY